MVFCRGWLGHEDGEGTVDGDGQTEAAAGVVVRRGGSTGTSAGAPVLPETQRPAGRGRVRPLGGTAVPAVLRAGGDAGPAERAAGRVLPHVVRRLLRGPGQPAGHRLAVRR